MMTGLQVSTTLDSVTARDVCLLLSDRNNLPSEKKELRRDDCLDILEFRFWRTDPQPHFLIHYSSTSESRPVEVARIPL